MNNDETKQGLLFALKDAAHYAGITQESIRFAYNDACYCNELARLLIEPLIGEMAVIKNKLDAILKGVEEC